MQLEAIHAFVHAHSDLLQPPFHKACLLLGTKMALSGLIAARNPIAYSDGFGLPLHRGHLEPKSAASDTGRAWVAVLAGREAAIGAAVLVLLCLRESKALSVLVSALDLAVLGDVCSSVRHGSRGACRLQLVFGAFTLWVGPLGLLLFW